MFLNRMFRERALARRSRQEPLDDRLQITAPHEWLIVAMLGLAVLGLILFAALGRVDRAVSYGAVLVTPGDRHYIVSPASGIVVDVLVGLNDDVSAGQPIAYVHTLAERERDSAIADVIEVLEERGLVEESKLIQSLLPGAESGDSTVRVPITSAHDGRVSGLELTQGQPLLAGSSVGVVRETSSGRPDVVAYVSAADAARIRAGMRANIGIVGPGGNVEREIAGEVVSVSSGVQPPPRWLLEQVSDVPPQPHEVHVALSGADLALGRLDGAAVVLRIVVGRESIASLLTPGGGG